MNVYKAVCGGTLTPPVARPADMKSGSSELTVVKSSDPCYVSLRYPQAEFLSRILKQMDRYNLGYSLVERAELVG